MTCDLGFAHSEPGYVFDKAILLQYDHMSFGGAPVEAGTEEEAEELMLQNDKDSANGNELRDLLTVLFHFPFVEANEIIRILWKHQCLKLHHKLISQWVQ